MDINGLKIVNNNNFVINRFSKNTDIEIVRLECFSFQDCSEIDAISGCLKRLNFNNDQGGIVFLFKVKKNLELLNRKFYISGLKIYIYADDINNQISILRQFKKKELVNTFDASSVQRDTNDDDLMQLGFIYFLNKQHDFNNSKGMFIETYIAIDDINTSYLIDSRIDKLVDGKYVSENLKISKEYKNLYDCYI